MNVRNAADVCRIKILEDGALEWYTVKYNLSVGHIISMLDQIVAEDITGEKAHRWIGWVQACMCMGEVANLDELKQINKDA